MRNDNKKPLLSGALVGDDNKGLESAKADNHRDRITRLSTLKHRSKQQENYLWSLSAFDTNTDKKKKNDYLASKSAHKLSGCGNYLLFKNYFTVGEVKLTEMRVCNQHLLCPFCASIRASRSIKKNNPRVLEVLRKNRKLKPVLLTLTVANGSDLEERQKHLMDSFRTLLKRRRDYEKKGRGFNEFCKLLGGFYSYENTFNEKTGEWHPHLHIFGVLEEWIDQEELSKTWLDITSDSMIVDIRRVRKDKEYGYSKAIAEVCKYALKFGDLSVEKTWEAYKVLKGDRKIGLRLSGSFGLLRGVKMDDEATVDDDLTEDLPYLEMVYKFIFGKKSYYNLEMTRHVEPQAKDDDEAEERQREVGRSQLATKDDVSALRVRGRAECECTKRGRKKAHWKIPPFLAVRRIQRVKRWDGFNYNRDLFPSIEKRLLSFILSEQTLSETQSVVSTQLPNECLRVTASE